MTLLMRLLGTTAAFSPSDAGAGATGGDAGAGAGAGAGAAGAAGAAGGDAGAANWFGGLNDEDRAWAASKGWKEDTPVLDVAKASLQSYRNLETMFGADKAGRTVLLPKDQNDKPAFDAIFEKLGKPQKPDDYKLPVPEGTDGAFLKLATDAFHKTNLTVDQAKGIYDWYRATELDAAQQAKTRNEQSITALEAEWGQAFEQNVEIGRTAMKAAGLEPNEIKALEMALTPGRLAKMMHTLGQPFAEGGAPDRDSRLSTGFSKLTPNDAKAKADTMMADKLFMERYESKDPKVRLQAIKEYEAVMELAYPSSRG